MKMKKSLIAAMAAVYAVGQGMAHAAVDSAGAKVRDREAGNSAVKANPFEIVGISQHFGPPTTPVNPNVVAASLGKIDETTADRPPIADPQVRPLRPVRRAKVRSSVDNIFNRNAAVD